MKTTFVDQTLLQLKEQYEQMRQMLLQEKNYLYTADLTNVRRYLHYLEASLQQPYNRIAHLAAFIHDADGLMSSRMYPMAFLRPDTKSNIYQQYLEIEEIMARLKLSTEEAFAVFEKEPHKEL